MDQENYDDVSALDATGAHRGKIHFLTEFCQEMRDTRVPDPYYGGQQGFDYVADLVEDACAGLLAHLCKKLSLS
jgi:protein-tyrosine phosphatase